MAIIKRVKADGSPSYRVVVHTPTQGHVTIGTFSRKKDAETAETEYKRSSRLEGVVFIPKRISMIDLATEWLNTRRLKPQTRQAYHWKIERIKDYFGNTPLTKIDRAMCESFTKRMADELSPRSANAVLGILKQVTAYAVECGYTKQDSAQRVKRTAVRQNKDFTLMTPQDHQMLIEATQEHYRSLVYLLPLTGLRIAEAMGLQWSDVDFTRNEIHVRRQRKHSGGFGELKSVSSERHIMLSTPAVKELKRWKLACPYGTDNLVFPSPVGSPLSHSGVYDAVLRPLKKLEGFERLTIHDFRHTFVSWLISAGADIKYVQDQCGHSSPSITLDSYGHMFSRQSYSVTDHMGDFYVTATLPPKEEPQVSGTEG